MSKKMKGDGATPTPINTIIFIAALIFLIILSASLFLFNHYGGRYSELFPSALFSFALDGLILFCAVSYMQNLLAERAEKNRIYLFKNSLNHIAAPYISFCQLVAYQHGVKSGDFDLFSYDDNAIADLHQRLLSIKINDDSESVGELVQYVREHKSTLLAALPIASQVSSNAGVFWANFLTQINIIDGKKSNYGPAISNSISCLIALNHRKTVSPLLSRINRIVKNFFERNPR